MPAEALPDKNRLAYGGPAPFPLAPPPGAGFIITDHAKDAAR